MKRTRLIPSDRLCPHCKRGWLICDGLKRPDTIGELTGKAYRKCDRCAAKVPSRQEYTLIEEDVEEEKQDDTPGLFDELIEDEIATN
ncbi:hypothetical protein EBZ39_03095 [bacterium]|nr:hypothetical protein [bacterium]